MTLDAPVDGTHPHVSRRDLPRYLGEFDFRYSTRKMADGDRTALTIQQAEAKWLRYSATAPTRQS